MPNDLENDLGFLIHDIARFMRRKFDREVRELGLTRAQWWVLVELLRDNGQTQSGLAENMELDKATLSSLVDKLEAAGFVQRRQDPSDRRIKRIFRTEKINGILPVLDAAGDALYAQAFAGLDEQDRGALYHLLLRIKKNLACEEAAAAADDEPKDAVASMPVE